MTTTRSSARSRFGRLAVMGVATLASAMVVAPTAAMADDLAPQIPTGEPTSPEATEPPSESSESPVPAPQAGAPEAAASEAAEPAAKALPEAANATKSLSLAPQPLAASDAAEATAAAAVAPTFGTGKNRSYRVDTQISPSAFAPAGTTTAGSTFDITTTLADGTSSTVTCTTAPATVTGARGYSTCPGPTGGGFPLNTYNAPPTATMVTIQQVTANENLVVNPEPFVLLPCTTGEAGCANIRNSTIQQAGSILPVTVDDELTIPAGSDPVRVDVLANDTSDDPNTTLTVTQPPEGQGTVRVVTNGRGVQLLRYVPPATFTGVVPITYTVTNSNGSTDGTLNVTVQEREFADSPANRGFRVTASIDPDADVPDDASSAGSTFSIVNTFNDQPDSEPVICTSVASTLTGFEGYSGCTTPNGTPPVFGIFPAPVGATSVVITQLTAPDGLAVDPDPYVLLPCTTGEDGCFQNRNTDFLLTAVPAPVTVDDTAAAIAGGDPVDVDVLDNDTSDSPVTGLTVTQPPAGQGTVEVIGEPADPAARATGAGTLQLRYTPSADFIGDVAITYSVSNAGGSTDGTLVVTVEAADVVIPPGDGGDNGGGDNGNSGDDTDDVAEEVAGNNGDRNDVTAANGDLPNAGGPGAELLGIGALLVAAGGGMTLAARRRRSTGVRAH